MKKFNELPYQRPDMDAITSLYEQVIGQLENAPDYASARTAYLNLEQKLSELYTMLSLCQIRNTIDTADPFYDEETKWFIEQEAHLMPLSKRCLQALSTSPFRSSFENEFGSQLLRIVDANLQLSDESIIQETIEIGELCQSYQKASASAKTEFRGESCNFYGLLKHMQSTDRAERREAFSTWSNLYEQISPELDETYDKMIKQRCTMAKKLGFSSYTEMAYLSHHRFDYSEEDVARFRRQILEVVTPAVSDIRERQRIHLGLDKIQYYDEELLFPNGNPNPIGTTAELIAKAQRMYKEMSPETGEFFDFMTQYQLYDLETRPGKHMGGYMTSLPIYKAPFIFSNFNGTSADVDVLTHEAGHAFQGYLAMRSIPISDLQGSTSEINEVHSMSMEHFAYPWMELFFGDNKENYQTAHLIGALSVLPYMAVVDEFQHRVYADPEMSAAKRRSVWRDLEEAYMPWRSYDGSSFLEEGGFWMQKQHIFLYPFYYIDYALAAMCAFQYYGRMKEDRPAAWQDYLQLCRAGGTKGYFELLKEGRLLNPFHDGTVEKSVGHIIDEIRQRY